MFSILYHQGMITQSVVLALEAKLIEVIRPAHLTHFVEIAEKLSKTIERFQTIPHYQKNLINAVYLLLVWIVLSVANNSYQYIPE